MNSSDLFTGERFVPGIEDTKLETEHYQRYLSVRSLIKDKVVLDAACGEGYGSNIIASVAKHVTGVDIDEDTIERAKSNYGSQSNISFLQASIEALPVPDNSVDVVVSFETIEHVPEEVQHKFLQEISRVLKQDGLLVMSTPNKEIYSDMHGYQNEFHVREFYCDEFLEFLGGKFKYIKLYNQAFSVVSLLSSCDNEEEQIAYYTKNQQRDTDGKYYIALASNQEIQNTQGFSSVYIEHSNEYEENIQRIMTLQKAEEGRNQHIQKLDAEAKTAGETIRELQAKEEEKNKHIERLDAEARTAGETIRELQTGEKERNLHIARLDAEIENKNLLLSEQDQRLVQMQEELKEAKEKSAIQQRSIEEYKEKTENLQQTIRNKEGHIELLLEVERAYEREKNTHSYKLAKKVQKIGDFVLPPNSKRRFFARVLWQTVRHPRLMLHVINPKRIKHYIYYMKLEGMEGVKRRYQETVDIERSHINPSSDIKLEKVEVNAIQKDITEYEPIELAVWKAPKVSIVIPVYNEFEYTYNCVKSIAKNSGDVSYEVIIANDCSTDITRDITRVIKNIQLVTTKKNVRFLLNCNNAAKYAKGEYILFLNNDTQVQENWLEPLVKLIESDEGIGMVGSKLIYPDGLLQEAGGIVWKDASAWNYGNRRHPDDPEFNYVKEADYISGAAIMIRKKLWKEIGGFDERFVPAYYEDTDLAFEVRKHGYKVMYQPLSRVVHFEGVSNGTDVQQGLKHYQQVNYEKFYEKWKEVLEAEHEVNAENVFTAKDRSNHKKHILVVDHYVPHHDQDAGGKCTYMYLQTFVKMGFKVTFIGDNFFKHEPYTTELNQLGIEVLYGNYYYNNWQDWLKENAHYFDYIYLQRPHISVKYIDLVNKYSNAKIFYFAHDLHHIREYREYEMTKNPEKLASAEKWKKTEYELFEKADVGHVVGSFEQGKMQEVFPDKPIRNIPLYIYENLLTDIQKDFASRNDILYVGGFGHPPNIDAVLWFAKEVYPKILEKYPNMKWHIVGGKVPLEVQELASDNIIVEGFLPDEDLEHLYRTCRMAVVPLRYGAGVKGKVVESAYFQIPLVTTSIGAEGLSRIEQFMVVEDEADALANSVCELYEDYDKLREMSDNGIDFISNHFTLKEAERILRLDMDI